MIIDEQLIQFFDPSNGIDLDDSGMPFKLTGLDYFIDARWNAWSSDRHGKAGGGSPSADYRNESHTADFGSIYTVTKLPSGHYIGLCTQQA